METITFEQLPGAFAKLFNKVVNIETILLKSESPTEQDQFLSIEQAADFLKLSIHTLYSLVSKNELPVSKKGKRLYFSKLELTEWIKAGRKKTNSEIKTEKNISHA